MKQQKVAKAELSSGVVELDDEALEQVVGGNLDHYHVPQDTGRKDSRTGREVYVSTDGNSYKSYSKKDDGTLERIKDNWKPAKS